jgi:hypothetical protein
VLCIVEALGTHTDAHGPTAHFAVKDVGVLLNLQCNVLRDEFPYPPQGNVIGLRFNFRHLLPMSSDDDTHSEPHLKRHGTVPNEQNTQQSPGLGRITV